MSPGDVLVLPAGTGHCNAGSSGDLVVVGAYPNGMRWDLRRGDPAEREEVLANIDAVPLPGADPVGRMRVRFLGTGASGGTPGEGRSRRRESSALVSEGRSRILIDVTRNFREQQDEIPDALDAVLLTHAHRDACGGLPSLRGWLQRSSAGRAPVYASPATIAAVRRRHRRLERCELIAVQEGRRRRPPRGRAWSTPPTSPACPRGCGALPPAPPRW